MAVLQTQELLWLEKARQDLGHSPSGLKLEQVTSDLHPLNGCSLEGSAIGKLVGVGSFAVVFELSGSDPSQGRLAVKAMPRAGGSDAAQNDELFQREVRIGRSLQHPNIARLHRFVELANSRFVVLDFIEGDTMAALAGQKLTVPEYRRLFSQLSQGLTHAHQQGVVHRDLKPENVMLSPGGSLKILDFGMARMRGDTAVTVTGQFKGTPMYCAPEQILDSKTVEATCDQFSFGLLSYQFLTGEFPYPLDSKQPLQTLFARLQQPAARLSSVWPEVGNEADESMARMLDIKPEGRFASVAEAFETFSQALPN